MSPAAARWSRIVDRSHRSPLSVREFARSEGVNPNTLAWWRWRLRDGATPRPGRFAEIALVEAPTVDQGSGGRSGCLVVQVGAAQIRVDASADLELLRSVVEVLT